MPFVDLVSADDYASLWYNTNTPNGHVGSFDPAKPTIVMLHPLGLDISWMYAQLEDNRLYRGYNIILFDTRLTGKSMCRPSGRVDLWVSAADLAFAFCHLNLPPAHIFAPEVYAFTALRLAALFPDFCLSLTLCNVPGQTEVQDVFEAFENLLQLWSYAEDISSLEHSCKEFCDILIGSDAHADLVDELVAYWEIHYPPRRRAHIIANGNFVLNRTPMNEKELASIVCPVLILQAERSATHPMSLAEQLASSLTGVPGGAAIFSVKSSVACLSLMCASIVNQVFNKFLSRQPAARSELTIKRGATSQRMTEALRKLSDLRNNPSIARRDPASPLSFSCLDQDTIDSQVETFRTYCKGQSEAFSPLNSDGRPIRKYSERNEHWLESASDGYSYLTDFTTRYIQKTKGRTDRQKDVDERGAKRPASTLPRQADHHEPFVFASSEPVSEELMKLGRVRRADVNPGAVDRHVIKGSMAKVVSGSGTVSIPRLLR